MKGFFSLFILVLVGALAGCAGSIPTGPVPAAPRPTAAPAQQQPVEPAPTVGVVKGGLEWRSVAQGDTPAPPQAVEAPALFVAADAAQAKGFVPADAQAQVEQAAGQGALIVAVYRGQVPTSGYKITVQSVSVAGDQVTIVAQMSDPGADQMVNQVISYPYQVLLVPQSQVPASATWRLTDAQGTVLREIAYP